jgi:hypothetical protein
MGLLTGDEFTNAFEKMFAEVEHTAFRFEVREQYRVVGENDPLEKFRAGEKDDLAWLAPWGEFVAAATAEGKRFSRVRAVSFPFSDYTRFGLVASAITVGAGEDIRYLDRVTYRRLGLPEHDVWIFDSARLAVLRFDAEDRPVGGELIDDPDTVLRHCQWRDVAWHYAIPREDFIARHGIRQ